jgi:DNA-binding CsgD family transcriptional regulator/ligand-binding sensor protein
MVAKFTAKDWLSVIGKERLQAFQDVFAHNNDIGVGIWSLDGKKITIPAKVSLLCHAMVQKNYQACLAEHTEARDKIVERGTLQEFTCYTGISYYFCPIFWNNELVAFGNIGGVAYPDSMLSEKLREKYHVQVLERQRFLEIAQVFMETFALLNIDYDKLRKKATVKGDVGGNVLDSRLSNREIQIVELICKGLSNKAIAENLYITEKTVKTHVSNILTKLDMKDRRQVIVYYANLQKKAKA